MTISTTANRNDYTATGGTDFAYTYKIFASTDLEVYVGSVLVTSGYTVSGVGSATGGTVAFTTAPTTGCAVALVRAVPYTQSVDLVDNDRFSSDTVEGAFDRLTILAQQVKELATRAVRFAAGSAFAATGTTLSDLQAGKLLRVNDSCNGIEMCEATTISPTTTTLPLVVGSGGTGSTDKHTARQALEAAPLTPAFITLGPNTELTCERVLTAGTNITFTDGGCGSTLTVSASGTQGLYGSRHNCSTNNAVSMCTKMDLIANKVVLTAVGATCTPLVFTSPATITNDIEIDVTNKQNSRDQAAAFSAGWIHFYWVSDGTSLYSRSSVNPPSSGGPVLPSCETYWAYSHPVYWDGNCLRFIRVQNSRVFYNCQRSILASGTANCQIMVNVPTYVPPNASSYTVLVQGVLNQADSLALRNAPNCDTFVLRGSALWTDPTGVQAVAQLPNVSQQFLYLFKTGGANRTADIDLLSYDVENGGA